MQPDLFVYHRLPKMHGKTLFPLNRMPDELADLRSAATKKYSWRVEVMSGKLPLLNCLWNDVLHFSPLHPNLLYEAQLSAATATGSAPPSPDELYVEIPL